MFQLSRTQKITRAVSIRTKHNYLRLFCFGHRQFIFFLTRNLLRPLNFSIMFEIEEVVVQKSYTEEEIYIDVFVALIQKKEAASILEKFCEEIPLQSYGLNHLKRIQSLNRSDKSCPLLIVVCPVKLYDEIPTHIKALCNEKEVRKVCRLEPQCRSEFEDWNVGWPINFHASHLEKEREKGLSVDEIKQVQFAFDVLLREEENSANIGGCGVVINPENGKVVTTTSDAHQFFMRKYNTLKPGIEIADERVVSSSVFQALHTATMQCIEGVAAVVRGDLKNGGNYEEIKISNIGSVIFNVFCCGLYLLFLSQRLCYPRMLTYAVVWTCIYPTSPTLCLAWRWYTVE